MKRLVAIITIPLNTARLLRLLTQAFILVSQNENYLIFKCERFEFEHIDAAKADPKYRRICETEKCL
jgi:hypothetical protein